MSTWAADIVRELAEIRLDNVFNPYAHVCPVSDRRDAPSIRRRNLEYALLACAERRTDAIWFGRDFGYRGGRRTGLSLTDEGNLETMRQVLCTNAIVRATKGQVIIERTATVIWDLIRRLPTPPVLWNAFPLHSHEPENPLSNRAHTATERQVTAWTIEELIEQLKPKRVIAIGNDAAKALTELGVDHDQVRHPSYGGQREFIGAMERLYALTPIETSQSDLFPY